MSGAQRGSIHIWVNRMVDDASSVSSLSTAFVVEPSSSFHENDNSVASFDVALLQDDDSSNDAPQEDYQQNNDKDWRWKSDPTLPLHRDLGKNVDMPVIPTRRLSSKLSAKALHHQESQTKMTPEALASLFQRPRMPRRQLSKDCAVCADTEEDDKSPDTTAPETLKSSSTSSQIPERLRRFPLDLPKRKLPTSSRIKRLTRPNQIPTRRNCTDQNQS